MRPDVSGVAQESAAFGPSSGRPPAQFESCLDHRGTGGSDPRLGAQLGLGGFAQAAQVAQTGNQILSDFDDIFSVAAAPEEDRKKLCVGERTRPAGQQPFSRTGSRREGKQSRHTANLSTWCAIVPEGRANSCDQGETVLALHSVPARRT